MAAAPMACTQLSTKERLRQRESALAEQCAERRRLEQQLRESKGQLAKYGKVRPSQPNGWAGGA
jgi:hypothetical protein